MAKFSFLSRFASKLLGPSQGLSESRKALQSAIFGLREAQAAFLQAPLNLQKAQARLAAAATPQEMAEARVGVFRARTQVAQSRVGLERATETKQKAQEKHDLESSGLAGVGGGLSAAGGHVKAAAQSSGIGAVAEHLLQAGGNIASMFGPTGQVLGAVMKFGGVLTGSTERLLEWSKQLHDANMQFAEVSGSMAMVSIQSNLRQFQINQERGERLAPSADLLAQQKDAYDAQTAPIKDFWGGMKNLFQAEIMHIATSALQDPTGNPLAGAIKGVLSVPDMLEQHKKGYHANTGDWMDKLGLEQWYEKYGRPPRFDQ